jgi:hypothetical protein
MLSELGLAEGLLLRRVAVVLSVCVVSIITNPLAQMHHVFLLSTHTIVSLS